MNDNAAKSNTLRSAIAKNLALMAAYLIAAYISISAPLYLELKSSVIWLPAGIALAAMLRYGRSAIPAIFSAHVIAGLMYGNAFFAAFGAALGGIAEYALGAYLLRRGGHFAKWRLSVRDTAALLVFGALLAPIAGAGIGTLALAAAGALSQGDIGRTAAYWWTGDAIGVLIMFPLAASLLLDRKAPPPRSPVQLLPFLCASVATAIIFLFVDGTTLGAHAFQYLIFPFIAWGAITMSTAQVASMNVVVTALAIFGTALGHGPYAATAGPGDIWLLQAFVSAVAATSLLLKAAMEDRRRSERRRQEFERRFREAADGNPSAVLMLRKVKAAAPGAEDFARDEFAVVYANAQAKTLLPRLHEVPAPHLSQLLAPVTLDSGMQRYVDVIARQAALEDEMQLSLPGIGARWLRQQAVPLEDGFILTLTDVTEHKLANEKVQYLATHDALTDLPNRTLLHTHLLRTIEAAGDSGSMIGVLFLDLDNFKTINDAHSHHIGDQVLTHVATRLKRCIGEHDMVARTGGDEFIVVASGIKGNATLAARAGEIIAAFAQPVQVGTREFGITFSIGIALYPSHSSDGHTLMRYADTAMYQAKYGGKNNFQFFTADMNARLLRRVAIEEALRGALQREELSLVYQPQIQVSSGNVIGAEALLRWQHKDLGWVPPDQFITVAEETGFINVIGQWVIEAVCAQCRLWREAGYELPRVAINLSARQLDERLPGVIRAALASAELDAANLELELTESYLMRDVDRNSRTLAELGAMGLNIAIDDFGTGYSSLSYLKRLPIDAVKIDKSFVRDLAEDAEGAQVVTAIVTLAHNLNLRCVAEGVESEAEFQLLRAIGCDEFQGHLHSKPVPAHELAQRYLTRREAVRV